LVSPKLVESLKHLSEEMSPDKGFQNYRNSIKNAPAPAIPFLGMSLSDLTLIDEGNPDEIVEDNIKKINFEKMRLISRVFEEFVQMQLKLYKNPYFFKKIPAMERLLYLDSADPPKDEFLYAQSLGIEPRSNLVPEEVNKRNSFKSILVGAQQGIKTLSMRRGSLQVSPSNSPKKVTVQSPPLVVKDHPKKILIG